MTSKKKPKKPLVASAPPIQVNDLVYVRGDGEEAVRVTDVKGDWALVRSPNSAEWKRFDQLRLALKDPMDR